MTVGLLFSLAVFFVFFLLLGSFLFAGSLNRAGFPVARGPAHAVGMAVGMGLVTLLPLLVAVLNFVGCAAIPKFLARPVWSVEALIYSKF